MNRGELALSYEKTLSQNFTDIDLGVSNCGYFISEKTAFEAKNTKYNHGYLLVYLHKGSALLNINKKHKLYPSGSVFIFKPYQDATLTYQADDVNERYFVYFQGKFAEKYLKKLNLFNQCVYNINDLSNQIYNFHQIIADFKIHSFEDELFRTTYLLNILTAISSRVCSTEIERPPKLFSQLLYKIENEYYLPFNIQSLSRDYGFSFSSLNRYFRKYTNTSPQKYITNTRLRKAKVLLLESNLSIAEISNDVGFNDPLYFSRIFKEKYKLNPTAYRKKYLSSSPQPIPHTTKNNY